MAKNFFHLNMDLPPALPREEQIRYFQDLSHGDNIAREKLIKHNLRLVVRIIETRFGYYDLDDLFSIGVIGLIKSVDGFDLSKETEFSSYASSWIYGEIKRYLRDTPKIPIMSIEKAVEAEHDGSEAKISDLLSDERDLALDYETKDIYRILNDIVDGLPERKREVVKLYFGFYDNIPKSQKEVAEITGLDQPYVSRLLKKALAEITLKLIEKELMTDYDLYIKKVYENKSEEKEEKEPKTLISILKFYSKSQIEEMFTRLTQSELELVLLRWGEDLENPKKSDKWTKKHQKKMNELYRKMRYLLANPEKESTPRKKLINKKNKEQ